MIALSPNDKTVQILDTKTWKVLFVLDEVRLFFSQGLLHLSCIPPHSSPLLPFPSTLTARPARFLDRLVPREQQNCDLLTRPQCVCVDVYAGNEGRGSQVEQVPCSLAHRPCGDARQMVA